MMKTKQINTAISMIALALAAGEVRGESAADIGTLPSQKVPASIDQGDRNPFATHLAPSEISPGNFDSESEESRIRQVFAPLQVNGRVPAASNGAARVLVGDLILKEGEEVPQVIENQTDVLRVTRIDDKEVELTWIDEEIAEAPRKLIIPIQLQAEVSFVLPGRGIQSGGQFVTMSNSDEEALKEKKDAPGRKDPLVSEDDEDEEGNPRDKTKQPEQAKKVSPFGLFRR